MKNQIIPIKDIKVSKDPEMTQEEFQERIIIPNHRPKGSAKGRRPKIASLTFEKGMKHITDALKECTVQGSEQPLFDISKDPSEGNRQADSIIRKLTTIYYIQALRIESSRLKNNLEGLQRMVNIYTILINFTRKLQQTGIMGKYSIEYVSLMEKYDSLADNSRNSEDLNEIFRTMKNNVGILHELILRKYIDIANRQLKLHSKLNAEKIGEHSYNVLLDCINLLLDPSKIKTGKENLTVFMNNLQDVQVEGCKRGKHGILNTIRSEENKSLQYYKQYKAEIGQQKIIMKNFSGLLKTHYGCVCTAKIIAISLDSVGIVKDSIYNNSPYEELKEGPATACYDTNLIPLVKKGCSKRFISIPVALGITLGGKFEGHATMVIIDNRTNRLIYFDPNGKTDMYDHVLIGRILKKVIGGSYTYVESQTLCPKLPNVFLGDGIQAIVEGARTNIKRKDKMEGFCFVFSFLFLVYILEYPEIPVENIQKLMLGNSKNVSTLENAALEVRYLTNLFMKEFAELRK